jgi:hypothetical protein
MVWSVTLNETNGVVSLWTENDRSGATLFVFLGAVFFLVTFFAVAILLILLYRITV